MKKAVVATLALSAGLVSAEDINTLSTDPLAVSTDLDYAAVQADCTVIKDAYQAADCGCDSGGAQRALAEKQSTMVALPREKTMAWISAARIAAARQHDIVASSNTEWRFWMTYQNDKFSKMIGYGSTVYNRVDIRRFGSSLGGHILSIHGDRYHLDMKRDTSSPPKLPAIADVYEQTDSLDFNGNQQYVLSNADAVFGTDKSTITTLTPTSRVYYRWIDMPSWFSLGGALVCNGMGGDRAWESTLMTECAMYIITTTFGPVGPVMQHKAWPHNYVKGADGKYYMDASPFPAAEDWVEKEVVTASGQTNVFYCPAANSSTTCGETTSPTAAQLAKHVDITMSNTPWSEFPDRASYEAEAIAFKNSFGNATSSLPDPTIQNLDEGTKKGIRFVLEEMFG